jgi:hypothetical protein
VRPVRRRCAEKYEGDHLLRLGRERCSPCIVGDSHWTVGVGAAPLCQPRDRPSPITEPGPCPRHGRRNDQEWMR